MASVWSFLKPVTSVLFLVFSLIGSSLRLSALSADAYIVSVEFANPYLVSPGYCLCCSWCVIVISAVGIVVYLFLVLSSLSSTVAVVAFFYSCLVAVVVHISVIIVIAVIVITVLLPLLPLSLLSALCTHPPGYTLRCPVGV